MQSPTPATLRVPDRGVPTPVTTTWFEELAFQRTVCRRYPNLLIACHDLHKDIDWRSVRKWADGLVRSLPLCPRDYTGHSLMLQLVRFLLVKVHISDWTDSDASGDALVEHLWSLIRADSQTMTQVQRWFARHANTELKPERTHAFAVRSEDDENDEQGAGVNGEQRLRFSAEYDSLFHSYSDKAHREAVQQFVEAQCLTA